MNYELLYARFIASRQGRVFSPGEYSERHHIVPRCEGGGDEPENLIRLSARDHLFAHLILAKWKGGVHWFSVYRTFGNKARWNELPTAQVVRLVAMAKQKFGEENRGDKSLMFGRVGEKCPIFGMKRSPETRAKMSAAKKGRIFSAEHREKLCAAKRGDKNPWSGLRHSPEAKEKMSAAAREVWARRKAIAQESAA